MSAQVEHIVGRSFHGRKGATENAFTYSIDYVLLDPEAQTQGPALFSRNRRNLAALHDRDHGGPPKAGRGAVWAREVLAEHEVRGVERLLLLAQPRVLGHVFNPVSFWLCLDQDERLIAVIAEVTNTYGDRHSYLCRHPDLRPIQASDRLRADKIFHVSPFQPVSGEYVFRFDIRAERVGIWIDYAQEEGGLLANLWGRRRPLTNGALLASVLRRPFGSRRVLALIHWQALKLWWKRAAFRSRPEPPQNDVSGG